MLFPKKKKEKKKDLKNINKKTKKQKNILNQIYYDRMFEDGICELHPGRYSKSFRFKDINYKNAKRDEQVGIFSQYCELLNYCDPSMHFQVNLINRKLNENEFKENMLFKLPDDESVLNVYRKEMNNILMEKALKGQNNLLHDRIFTFSSNALSYSTAISTINREEDDLISLFQSLGASVEDFEGEERLREIFKILNPEEEFTFKYKSLVNSNLTTKAHILPSLLDFGISENYFKFGEYYGQVLCMRDFPAEVKDDVLTKLSELPLDLVISIHFDNVEQAEALEYVKKQIAFMEMEATDKQDVANQKGRNTTIAIPMETRRSYEEALKLLDDLENKNQRMFKVTILVFTYAKSVEKLEENVFQIVASGRQNTVKIDKLPLLQKEALNSILPLGENFIPIKRTFTTAQAAIFMPFNTQDLYQKGGLYYGQNSTNKNLIMYDRTSLPAPNGMILGTPGSGKSFASKREIISVLLRDNEKNEVIIIDPEREYTSLAYGFDGEIIHISAGSNNHLNPMDINIDYAGEEDPINFKAEFILSLCELILSNSKGTLSSGKRSIISRVCKNIYVKYLQNIENNEVPTLRDFYDEILKQPEEEAKSLALDLEIYITGTLSTFAHHTNVDIKKKLVVYDVKDLGKQLKAMGMLIVMDQVWNRITINREKGVRTWIYVDEFQLLLKNPNVAEFFFELWSRARKWGAVPTAITQNVETMLLSDEGRRMLSNSLFVLLFDQAASDRNEIAALRNISNTQLSKITNALPGHGLLISAGDIIPFSDEFPKETKLYKMINTKFEEITQEKEEEKTWQL